MRLSRHLTGIVAIPALFAAVATAQEDTQHTQSAAIQYGSGFYGTLPGAVNKSVFTTAEYQFIDFAVRTDVAVKGVTLLYDSTPLAVHSGAPANAKREVSGHGSSITSDLTDITAGNSGSKTATAKATWTLASGPQTLTVTATSAQTQSPTAATVSVVFNPATIINNNFDKPVYFKVDWVDDAGALGYTESQELIYIPDGSPDAATAAASMLPATAMQIETTTGTSAASSSSASKKTTATTTGTSTTGTAAAKSSSSSLPNNSAGPAPAKSSKGLAGGAIAGIVVGIVALLLIAGVAAFFLLRRRKNASAPAGGYRGSGSEQIGLQSGFASAAVVEKDGFGGGSAHSPYTDDASNYVAPVSAAAAAPAPVSAAAPAPAPPKQAVSNQVAALIEDHMTPDEIARLAAEEEELDAAIAKAHRSRQASQA